jgi:2,3-bisphosphoglycerate-independent phosphoglycerate mutase
MKLDNMTHKQLLELRDRLATSDSKEKYEVIESIDSIIYKELRLENSLVVTGTSAEID